MKRFKQWYRAKIERPYIIHYERQDGGTDPQPRWAVVRRTWWGALNQLYTLDHRVGANSVYKWQPHDPTQPTLYQGEFRCLTDASKAHQAYLERGLVAPVIHNVRKLSAGEVSAGLIQERLSPAPEPDERQGAADCLTTEAMRQELDNLRNSYAPGLFGATGAGGIPRRRDGDT